MTTHFSNLLHLLSCAVHSQAPDLGRTYDFESIYKLAKVHQVHTIIFPVIAQIKTDAAIDETLFQQWKRNYTVLVSRATQRKVYMAGLLRRLEEKGIGYCILKGESLSGLYGDSVSRISSDVDLWIDSEEEIPTVLNFLAEDGFTVKPNLSESHQTECVHPIYGLIEVHNAVCDETAYKIWFENQIAFDEPFARMTDDMGNSFYTLSITDGAIFVTFHFLKHFLSHGCGCRQLTDMLLYLKHYDKEINWDRFNKLFADLRYLEFINLCKQIGNLYFSMDFPVSDMYDRKLCDAVLTDIETSGVFGKDEQYRVFFTHYFTDKRKSQGRKVSFSAKKHRILSYLKRRQYNLFVAARDFLKRNKKVNQSSSAINKRLQLFEDLGIFD